MSPGKPVILPEFLSASKKHIGFYPSAEAMEAFKEELKNNTQFTHSLFPYIIRNGGKFFPPAVVQRAFAQTKAAQYLQFKTAQAKSSLNPLTSGNRRPPHKYQSSPYHCSCP